MSRIPVITFRFLIAIFLTNGIGFNASAFEKDASYQSYIDFFEEVYQKMQEHYYVPVERSDFDRFVETFDDRIYGELQNSGKSDNYIKWRSASYLVKFLKQEEDSFSKFFPPKPAQEYEQTVLGVKINLGIEGERVKDGYLITKLEPRSDPYEKGIRVNDKILRINGKKVTGMTEEKILDLLTPEEGEVTKIVFYDDDEKIKKTIEVLSKEYFHQTVFMVPVEAPNVFCLKIERFNRKTSEDMFNLLALIQQQATIEDPGLILDLRGNPGGPPLAAREISSFFLTPEDDFAYFQKRDNPKALLTVPEIPQKFRFAGDVVILIDEQSGSASELFSGAMKFRDRAFLMGENSAGRVLLKSMFYFEDESMVLLVTGRGHYPDGQVYSFDGVAPDKYVNQDKRDLVQYAAAFLVYMRQRKN